MQPERLEPCQAQGDQVGVAAAVDDGVAAVGVDHAGLHELARVGLGGLIDAADMAPVSRMRRLGPQ